MGANVIRTFFPTITILPASRSRLFIFCLWLGFRMSAIRRNSILYHIVQTSTLNAAAVAVMWVLLYFLFHFRICSLKAVPTLIPATGPVLIISSHATLSSTPMSRVSLTTKPCSHVGKLNWGRAKILFSDDTGTRSASGGTGTNGRSCTLHQSINLWVSFLLICVFSFLFDLEHLVQNDRRSAHRARTVCSCHKRHTEWVDYLSVGGEQGLETDFFRWIALRGYTSTATYFWMYKFPLSVIIQCIYAMYTNVRSMLSSVCLSTLYL